MVAGVLVRVCCCGIEYGYGFASQKQKKCILAKKIHTMRLLVFLAALAFCLLACVRGAVLDVTRPKEALTNWPLSNLTAEGFQICLTALFSATGPTFDEMNILCPGPTIAIGCRGAGSDTLVTVAFGSKAEVFANLTASPTGTVADNSTNRFYYNPVFGSTARIGYTGINSTIPTECVFAGAGGSSSFCRNMNGTQISPGGFCGSIGVTSDPLVQMVVLSAPCEGIAEGGSCNTPDGLCASLGTCAANKTCVGSVVTPLPVLATCESSVTCKPISGALVYTYRSFGFPCDDLDNCTINDRCPGNSGVCSPGIPKFIPPPAACFDFGICLSPSGNIFYPPISSGPGTVSDGNPCTLNDFCVSGVLTPGPLKLCNSTNCFNKVCDPLSLTGECVDDTPKTDGTLCEHPDKCVTLSTCLTGSCVPLATKNLTAGSCFTNVTCNPLTGAVSGTFLGTGVLCDDQDPCTAISTCNSLKECKGTVTLTCPSNIPCLGSATPLRNPNNTCSCPVNPLDYPVIGNGLPCTSTDVCALNSICISGSCTPQGTKVCVDQPCTSAGPCNPLLTATGGCAPKPNGTSCSSGSPCFEDGECGGGVCYESLVSSPGCITAAAAAVGWIFAA